MHKFSTIEPYIVIAGLIIVTFLTIPFLQELPHDQMHSIVLPLQKLPPRATLPTHVRLYPFEPGMGTPIALINIERHYEEPSQAITQEMEQEAKRLAASIGADAVIIKNFGRTKENKSAFFDSIYVFRGVAMRLHNEA